MILPVWNGMAVISTYLLVVVFAWLVTSWIRYYALKNAILDHPNHRSLHTQATPRGGGSTIALLVFVMLFLFPRSGGAGCESRLSALETAAEGETTRFLGWCGRCVGRRVRPRPRRTRPDRAPRTAPDRWRCAVRGLRAAVTTFPVSSRRSPYALAFDALVRRSPITQARHSQVAAAPARPGAGRRE